MITIAGKAFNSAPLMQEYAPSSVEALVLKQMADSTYSYKYDTLDTLKFELKLRAAIVNAAKQLYNSRMRFAIFQNSRCNEQYWNRTSNGGFELKDGVRPSAAINDIFINGSKYATECATAMVIVYYKALLDTFGATAFDRLFPDPYLMNWRVTDPLLREVGVPVKVADLLLGDRAYFANPDVDPRTPQWQGENAIVLPNGLYYGHGIGIEDANTIIRALNDSRKPGATRTAYLMDSAGRPDFKKLSKLYYNASSPQAAPLVWKPFPPSVFAV